MYKKLVRDNIPDIIKANGEIPVVEVLSDNDYKKELEKKLFEECQEVLDSTGIDRIEELADLLEVMISLAELENKTFYDIIELREDKKSKRGGFSKRLFLKGVN